jgi:hypothetical protein
MLALCDNLIIYVNEVDRKAEFWSPEQLLSIIKVESDIKLRVLQGNLPQRFGDVKFSTVTIKKAAIEEALA